MSSIVLSPRIPSVRECNELRRMTQQGFGDRVMQRKINSHVECVHEIGMRIARRLPPEFGIHLPLLDRALRLHDVCKHTEPHEHVAATFLHLLGYPDVAELVRFHMLETFYKAHEKYGAMPTVLAYADARSGMPTSTTLQEREVILNKRYGVVKERERGFAVLKDFEKMLARLGISTDFTGIEDSILIVKDLIVVAGEKALADAVRALYEPGRVEVKHAKDEAEAIEQLKYSCRMIGFVAALNEEENARVLAELRERKNFARVVIATEEQPKDAKSVWVPKNAFEEERIKVFFHEFIGPGETRDGIPL